MYSVDGFNILCLSKFKGCKILIEFIKREDNIDWEMGEVVICWDYEDVVWILECDDCIVEFVVEYVEFFVYIIIDIFWLVDLECDSWIKSKDLCYVCIG